MIHRRNVEVNRYINEAGTEQGWCERADERVLSVIALPEMISAFCRRAAQVCEADVFVSADTRQCTAAQAMGLQVVAV